MDKNQQEKSRSHRSVIIASNRGPVTFKKEQNGDLTFRRGTGGLVTALSGLFGEIDATWISCAMSEEDKKWGSGQIPFRENQESINIKFISPDEETYEGYYNVIANPLLWFLQHSMWNLPHSPVINRDTWKAWEDGYVAVNKEFSNAIVEHLQSHQNRQLLCYKIIINIW